jgi:anaerobic magnesium-protoporphyrin IX monomethyl ester cyclase
MKKKVLLITPPYHSGVVESAGTWLNLGFVYLAGSLRKAGYEVEIYDAMSYFHEWDEIQKRIENSKPDVVASTAITASIYDAIHVLELAKQINPETVTVIGSIHPTFCWDEVLRENPSIVDYAVIGEGEITLPELLDCHFAKGNISKVRGIAYWDKGKAVATAQRDFVYNLDELTPAWDLVDWGIYSYRPKEGSTLAIINSSRGCNQQCSFCSQQLFWKRQWRARSPENFVAELEHLQKGYGVNVAMIPDENPTFDRTRWERILDMLIERAPGIDLLMETRVEDVIRDRDILWKYKKAGVVHIYVGVESVNQATLDMFNKNVKIEESKLAIDLINQQDMVSETSFVLGIPEETKESIRTTVELAKHYNPDMAFFLAIAPWPYADLYNQLEPYIITKDYSKYNLVEPVVKPVNMSIKDFAGELLHATRVFYMDKMPQLDTMSSYKREFMLSVMRLFMEHSYLAEEIKGIVPPEIKKHIDNMKSLSPIP